MVRRSGMAPKAQSTLLFSRSKLFTLSIIVSGVFAFAQVAVCASSEAIGGPQTSSLDELSDSLPSKVSSARVQSSAQKIVQEEAVRSKPNGSMSPLQSAPKSGGRIKKVGGSAASSSADKNEMRPVRGSAIQDDDSLSSGSGTNAKASKGKSSGNKDDF